MPDRWWKEFLYERLRGDPQFAKDYLRAAHGSGDPTIYESALLDIEQAMKSGECRRIENDKDTLSG